MPDTRPYSWLRLAVLLGVGFLAVSLLSPANAWAKGAAASTPSYSFPAAVRGDLLAMDPVHPTHIPQAAVGTLAVFLMSPFAN